MHHPLSLFRPPSSQDYYIGELAPRGGRRARCAAPARAARGGARACGGARGAGGAGPSQAHRLHAGGEGGAVAQRAALPLCAAVARPPLWPARGQARLPVRQVSLLGLGLCAARGGMWAGPWPLPGTPAHLPCAATSTPRRRRDVLLPPARRRIDGELVMRAYTPSSSDDQLGYFELVGVWVDGCYACSAPRRRRARRCSAQGALARFLNCSILAPFLPGGQNLLPGPAPALPRRRCAGRCPPCLPPPPAARRRLRGLPTPPHPPCHPSAFPAPQAR